MTSVFGIAELAVTAWIGDGAGAPAACAFAPPWFHDSAGHVVFRRGVGFRFRSGRLGGGRGWWLGRTRTDRGGRRRIAGARPAEELHVVGDDSKFAAFLAG